MNVAPNMQIKEKTVLGLVWKFAVSYYLRKILYPQAVAVAFEPPTTHTLRDQ